MQILTPTPDFHVTCATHGYQQVVIRLGEHTCRACVEESTPILLRVVESPGDKPLSGADRDKALAECAYLEGLLPQ